MARLSGNRCPPLPGHPQPPPQSGGSSPFMPGHAVDLEMRMLRALRWPGRRQPPHLPWWEAGRWPPSRFRKTPGSCPPSPHQFFLKKRGSLQGSRPLFRPHPRPEIPPAPAAAHKAHGAQHITKPPTAPDKIWIPPFVCRRTALPFSHKRMGPAKAPMDSTRRSAPPESTASPAAPSPPPRMRPSTT